MRMQVKLEIGHKASCRQEPTPEGFTHDWTVFVRGSEGKDISHFVEKVVFHLHESFPRPKRVVKEAPYKLDECGYGSFELKIEVCFKTKEEPRKVTFPYDLFLPLNGYPPVTNVRTEALTFTHSTDDFMKKLIKGGGLQISSTNGVSVNGLSNGHGNTSRDESKEAPQKNTNIPDNDRGKKMKLPKATSKPAPVVGMKRSPPSHEPTAVENTAKKKKKPSEGTSSSSKGKHSAPVQNEGGSQTSLSTTNDAKDVKVKFKSVPPKESEKKKDHGSESHQKGKVLSHSSKGKDLKSHTEHAPTSESKPKGAPASESKPKGAPASESKPKGAPASESKPKGAPASENKPRGDAGEHKTKVKKKVEKTEKIINSEKKERKEKKDKKEKKEKTEKGKKIDKVTIRRSSGDSWASSGSSCGLMTNVVGKNTALGKLLSVMSEDEDERESLPTPFKEEPSPVLPKAVGKEQSTDNAASLDVSRHRTKDDKTRLNHSNTENSSASRAQNDVKEMSTSGSEADEAKKISADVKNSPQGKSEEKNGVHRLSKKELYDLYEQITNCQDSDDLQKVVDVIETTGLYTVGEKTFEFDLCCLEKTTLRKIQKCLAPR